MLGERLTTDRRKTYLNIKEGAVVRRTQEGEKKYSFVAGRLEGITQRERVFKNETVVYWYIDLFDTETGDLYSLGSPYASNTFKSIILQLASKEGLEAVKNGSTVKIEPYLKNGFSNVQVYTEGIKLGWAVKQLPPLEEATIGGRTIKDDSKRMELICSLVDTVRESLSLNKAIRDFSNIND